MLLGGTGSAPLLQSHLCRPALLASLAEEARHERLTTTPLLSARAYSGSLMGEEEPRHHQDPWCLHQLWMCCVADVQVDGASGCFMLHRMMVARKV